MSASSSTWSPIGVTHTLVLALALAGLACAVEAPSCEEPREQLGPEAFVEAELSAELALAELDAAPAPTLSWNDPAVIDDGWGAAELSVEHVGQCTTALEVEVELREDEGGWGEVHGEGVCAPPVLLVPVHITITSGDGVLAIDVDGGLVVDDPARPSFTVVLDSAPRSLGLQLGPPGVRREAELVLAAELVEGRLIGDLRLFSHDCTAETECTYWAEHILASFG